MTKTKLFGMFLETVGGWLLGTFCIVMLIGGAYLNADSTHTVNELLLGSAVISGTIAVASFMIRVGNLLTKNK